MVYYRFWCLSVLFRGGKPALNNVVALFFRAALKNKQTRVIFSLKY